MTLVLEISPEAEARLKIFAAGRGSVAGIREGLADLEAERTYSLEETFACLKEQRAARRKAKETQQVPQFQSAATA